MPTNNLGRRRFLALGGGAVLLAACQAAPAPTPAPAKPTEPPPTKPAEAAKPTVAPAATSAPAANATGAPASGTSAPAAGATSAPSAAATSAPLGAATAAPAAAGAAPAGKITILQTADVESFDPNILRSAIGLNVGQQVQEGLVDRALKPLLATGWKNPDDKTWVFDLRPNVKFHNGEPFDAAAVKFSIERALDDTDKAPVRAILGPVIDKVEVASPTQVKITTKQPFALLLESLLDVWMVPPNGSKASDFGNKGVGTGPYIVQEWARGERVTLNAFPDYWGTKPKIGQVVFRPVAEPSVRMTELRSGGADVITVVPPQSVGDLDQAGLAKVQRRSVQCMRVVFKADSPPFNDPRVRQAFNYAIDKDGILKGVLRGAGYVMNGPLGPDMFGYNETVQPYAFDPDKAKSLMKDAGVTNLEVQFQMPNGRFFGDKAIGEAMVDQLGKVGVKLNANFMDFGTWIQQFNKAGHGYLVLGQDAFPHRLFTSLSSKLHPVTWYGYANPKVDDLIDQASQTIDEAKRRDMYRQLHQIVRDDAAWLFLYNTQDNYGTKNTVKGFAPSADGYFYVKDVSIG